MKYSCDLEVSIKAAEIALKLRDLRNLSEGEIMAAHQQADELLCELLGILGFSIVADEFKKVPKWYA